jgi:hypothetical protein
MSNGDTAPDRKPSVVAIVGFASSLVALTLSLNTCVYNIFGFLEKSRLSFVSSEQITLYVGDPNHRPYLAMVTDFNVFNSSRADKYGVVTGERVEFTINGQLRVLRWQEFGKWGENQFEPTGPIHPFSVPGGTVISEEVSFTPRSKASAGLRPGEAEYVNWFDWSDFIQFLDKASMLPVHCVLELQGGGTVTADVEVQLTEGVKGRLRNPKVRWAAAPCQKL